MNIKLDALAIKKFMAEKRMTTAELARLSGINSNTITRATKRGTCTVKTAGLIAAALDVSVEEIWKEE